MSLITILMLLLAGVVIMILVYVCTLQWIFHEASSLNQNNLNDINSRGSTSMSLQDVEKLPCFKFVAEEDNQSPNNGSRSPRNCAVCLESFKVGEKCRLLPPCSHSFHAECVDAWLLKMPNCPICRSRFTDNLSSISISSSDSRSDLTRDLLTLNRLSTDNTLDEVSVDLDIQVLSR